MPNETRSTRLVDLCEPIFAVVCDINRLGRNNVHRNIEAVRNEVLRAFDAVERATGRTNLQERQWKAVEPALCCFVDSMIENSSLPEARDWRMHRLAEARHKILTGEDAFFDDYLDPDLQTAENDPEAQERLEVYFACLYLGFEGKHAGSPDRLQRVQAKVAGRLRQLLSGPTGGLLTPSAYQHLNETKLNLDSAPAMWGALILSGFFILVFFLGTTFLYRSAVSQLSTAVETINEAK